MLEREARILNTRTVRELTHASLCISSPNISMMLVRSNSAVVKQGFDKYHLIPRVLFSCFKPPTVITSLASVITVGGLKHENNTLGIRWYLV